MRDAGSLERMVERVVPFFVDGVRRALASKPGVPLMQSIGVPGSRAVALEVWRRLRPDERERLRLFDSGWRCILVQRNGRRVPQIPGRLGM